MYVCVCVCPTAFSAAQQKRKLAELEKAQKEKFTRKKNRTVQNTKLKREKEEKKDDDKKTAAIIIVLG